MLKCYVNYCLVKVFRTIMNKTWVTHLPHLLDELGNIKPDLPRPARQLATALCSFVTYATNFEGADNEELPTCFVIIKNKRCMGQVVALPALDENDSIAWQCEACDSHGVLSGWQGSLWDLSERGVLQ
jgi:hypothetical protein